MVEVMIPWDRGIEDELRLEELRTNDAGDLRKKLSGLNVLFLQAQYPRRP